MVGFDKFYIVTHSAIEEIESDPVARENKTINCWGPKDVALLSLRAGLSQWLLDRTRYQITLTRGLIWPDRRFCSVATEINNGVSRGVTVSLRTKCLC